MEKYWQKVHDEALAGMQAIISKLSDNKVDDNCDDMECALAFVLRHGTCKMKARAHACFVDYKWAKHEIAAHAAMKDA